METRRQAAARQLALENGPVDDTQERIEHIEATMAEMDERMGQVNHRLDRILDGIDGLVQTITTTQESTRQNTAAVNQVQDAVSQTVAALTELQAHIGAMGQVQDLAQQTAAAVATMQQQASVVQPPSEHRRQQEDVVMAAPTPRQLRKMEAKPPIFEGDINGVKLNSFLFQFESYFTFKGYDLVTDDAIVGRELGQCVRKNAATWYETYMTSPMTVKTWSAMKLSMEKNFKEPNFQQKLRNELLNFKQQGSYQGYVAKFQEKLRLVPLDPVFAKEIFLKGLTSNNLRKQILRKKPETLEDVIAEGFSEVELDRLEESKPERITGKGSHAGHSKGHPVTKNGNSSMMTPNSTSQNGAKRKCPHCNKGFHDPDNCWVKYPEKRPQFRQTPRKPGSTDKTDYKAKYFALVDKLIVDDASDAATPLNE